MIFEAIIPQCLFCMTPDENLPVPLSLRLASIHALSAMVDVCPSRMLNWKVSILDGLTRCWIVHVDEGIRGEGLLFITTN